jgi:hypothetical protein
MPIHRQGLALLVAAFTKKSIIGIFRQEYNITITKSRHDFGHKRGDISNPMSQRKDWSEKSRNGTQYFSKFDIPKSSCCIPPCIHPFHIGRENPTSAVCRCCSQQYIVWMPCNTGNCRMMLLSDELAHPPAFESQA